MTSYTHRISIIALAVCYIVAGFGHFASPATYLGMMPPYLPFPFALIYISGVAEIAGGIGVIFQATRRAAGWGLIALLIAVLPANIYAAQHGMMINGHSSPAWILWLRIPCQIPLIAWVYFSCVKRK